MIRNKQEWSFWAKIQQQSSCPSSKILFISSLKQYLKEIWYNVEGNFFLIRKKILLVKWLQSSIFYTKRETTLRYLNLAAASTFKGQEYTSQQWKQKPNYAPNCLHENLTNMRSVKRSAQQGSMAYYKEMQNMEGFLKCYSNFLLSKNFSSHRMLRE